MKFYVVYEKFPKSPPMGLKNKSVATKHYQTTKKKENYSGLSPDGATKRKSNNDDKHGNGQKKRRPSTLC